MADMDWVTCKIMLGGDIQNVLYRSKFNPVSVPELDVIRRIHGEPSVNEVTYAMTTPSSPQIEKERLLSLYKEEDVNAVYPGRNPNGMPMLADDHPDGEDTDDEDEDIVAVPKKSHKSHKSHKLVSAAKRLDASILDKPEED